MRIIAFVFVVLFLNACSVKEGSGNIVTEKRDTRGFEGIRVSGGFEVEVTKGATHSVTIEADDNLIRHIETKVINGILVIKTKDHNLRDAHLKAFITMPELNKVDVSASATVLVKGPFTSSGEVSYEASSAGVITADINTPEVVANASSSGEINLTGRTRLFKASASSGGEINAKNLLAENSTVECSSGASVKVYASVALNANASSGASVNYRGGAINIKKSVSSGGSVDAGE